MINTIKKIRYKLLPAVVDNWLREISFNYHFKQTQLKQTKALAEVREKEKVKVAFFIFKESVWKFEELYHLMEKDNRFEPVVVICPFIVYGEETMHKNMKQAYTYFKAKGYTVVKTLKEESGEWLNVKKEIKPDIVFFSAPWYITKSDYLIKNYTELLTCYVPYTFVISYLYQGYFNRPMQNFVWKFFLETKIHQQLSQKYARNKGMNTVVSGYPGMDKILQKDYQPTDVWKIKDSRIKRIIWSPHHTIPGNGSTLDYSTFLKYYDFMFEIAFKYQDQIQIAFKPHPSLRSKLSLEEVWGREKTNKYYNKWANLPNGQLNEGEYIDLFSTSDGMINDSSAFVIEYLYTNKPQLFLINDESVSDRFNEVGKTAMLKHYKGQCEMDIDNYLKNVILIGNDTMQNERIQFFNDVVKPPNDATASENIYNYLVSEIF